MSVSDLVLTPTGLLFAGRRFACTIGRGGISRDKREGDGATPVGIHHITGMFYRPDRLRGAVLPDWAQPIRLGDLWSDDVGDPMYNQLVRAPHRFSHEHMRRADPLYNLVMTTDWNWPNAIAGRGSAIFLHQWRRIGYPTAGCVAFAPADLLWIAARVRLGARLVVKA
ncbi:L,D-transpeptidase [Pseudorhodobacter sp. W20_MBD10_FR17]|uniref:L,D-transpeptidase family protein n=1 Tax=Pseudorhodobacter sp. W20_MBD10_FR17 TaxID=3240266 RepID=UPI003F9C0D45